VCGYGSVWIWMGVKKWTEAFGIVFCLLLVILKVFSWK
jgi:hypothetical protein